MRILGIDPGLRTTGFGVIESEGAKLRYVASGTIKTESVESGSLPLRLKLIFDGVREVAARYEPQCASVEIVFVNVNPQSTLDRKSTRLNSSHSRRSRMPSSA